MAGRLNKEYASMDAVVNNVHTVNLVFGIQISIVTLLDVVNNGSPRLIIVHEVAKTRGVDNGEAETDAGFLNVCADGLDRDSLGYYVKARSLAVLGGV